jgi:hypothetical protein
MKKNQKYYTLKEAAEYIGITEGCLRNLKYTKDYDFLPYEKVIGRLRYKKEVLDQFIEENVKGETEESKNKLRVSHNDKLDKALSSINIIRDHQLAIARHLGLQNEIMREKEAELRKQKILKVYGKNDEHTSS